MCILDNDLERVYFENARQYTSLWFFKKLVEQRHVADVYIPRIDLKNMIELKTYFKDHQLIHNFAELDNDAYRRVCVDMQVFNEVGTRQDIYFMADESYAETVVKLVDYLQLSWAAQAHYLARWQAESGESAKEVTGKIKQLTEHLDNWHIFVNHLKQIDSIPYLDIYTYPDVLEEAAVIVNQLDYLRYSLIAENKKRELLLSVQEYEIVDGIISEISMGLADVLPLAPYSKDKSEFEELMALPPIFEKQQLLKKCAYLSDFDEQAVPKSIETLYQHIIKLNAWVLNINKHSLVALTFYVKPKMLEQLNNLPATIEMFNYLRKMLSDQA